jgi:hypothetical protein
MAGNVVEMVLRLKDGASASLKSAGKSAKAADIDMKKLAKGAAAVGAGFLAATVLIVKFTQKMADYKNEVIDASTRTGIAVDTLAGLRLAAKGSGLQFSAMESVLKVYTSKIAAADRGSAEAVEGFEALGVSIHDDVTGNLRDSDVVFREVLARLGEMEPGSERTAKAINALGTQSTKLFQALGDPSNLDYFVEKTRLFGVNFGPKASKAAADWQRAMADLEDVMMGAGDKISREFGADGAAGAVFAFNEAIIFVTTLITEAVIPAFESWKLVIQDTMLVLATTAKSWAAHATLMWEGITGDPAGAIKRWKATIKETEEEFKQFSTTGKDMATAMTGGINLIGDAWDKAGEMAAEYRKSTQAPEGDGDGKGGKGGKGGKDGAGILSGITFEVTDAELAEADRAFSPLFTGYARRFQDGLTSGLIGATQASAAEAAEVLSRSKFEIRMLGAGERLQAGGQAAAGFGQAILGGAGAPAVGGVSSIVSLLAEGPKAIRESAADLQKSLMTAMKTLPIAIGEILPEFLTKLPAAIVDAIPALIAGMVEATPKMMKAVAVDLPIAIGRAILEADWSGMVKSIGESFKSWWESIKDWIANLFSVVDRNEDGGANWKRIGLAAATGGASEVVRGVSNMGSFQAGARFVDRTGMALIHKNEQIIPRGGSTTGTAARTMGGGGGVNVTINTNVVDSDALPALVRQLERVFGTFGRSSSTLFAS